jgi:geranylgeranyldiphosphate transferase
LQNDCKNVFSSDVVTAKGALAEDLINGEYSFPIIVALYSAADIRSAVSEAMCRTGQSSGPHLQERLSGAAMMLQKDEVRNFCLAELEALKKQNMAWASLWGRKEEMVVTLPKKADNDWKVSGLMGVLRRRVYAS